MKASVCIQAGGQSRRMGQNKALLSFEGSPLIQRVVERVRPVASEILIISHEPAMFEFLHLPVLPDLIAGKGVLGGLYTSLAESPSQFVIPVACDMPFVNSALLQAELDLLLTSGADIVVPESPNGLEPLHAVYRRESCLPWVKAALLQEQRRLIGWFDRVKVRVMTQAEAAEFDPDHCAFININTPEDLARAEQLARTGA
jgi:molybdopterin-guanine dinucleotide biosynthesis protein A